MRLFAPKSLASRAFAQEAPVARRVAQHRKVDARLPGKGNSKSRGARKVHLIITRMKWIRTRRLSIKNSLSLVVCRRPGEAVCPTEDRDPGVCASCYQIDDFQTSDSP